jgi:hypothetical protein
MMHNSEDRPWWSSQGPEGRYRYAVSFADNDEPRYMENVKVWGLRHSKEVKKRGFL